MPLDPALGILARGVFFRFKISHLLKENGGFCNLILNRFQGEPGSFHIAFFEKYLFAYNGDCFDEKIDNYAPPEWAQSFTFEAGKWLHLYVKFDWEFQRVIFFVNGAPHMWMDLHQGGGQFNGVHSLWFRGPNPEAELQNEQGHKTAWSHVYVERKTSE